MMDRIYMDNAATTAICPEALAAMLPCFGEHFGNASSIHGTGRDARKVLEDARRTVAVGDLRQLLDGLDRADLVVRRHDGDQRGVVPDGLFQVLRIHDAELVHWQICDLEALLLQLRAGMQQRVVLDLAGDDVVALFPVGEGRALDSPVIAFRAAGGEINLGGLGP